MLVGTGPDTAHNLVRQWHLYGPLFGTAQNTKNPYDVVLDCIAYNKRCALNDQFACSSYSTWATYIRELLQSTDLALNSLINQSGIFGTVDDNVLKDFFAVGNRKVGPFQFNQLFHLAECIGSQLRKLGRYFCMGDQGTRIIQRLLDSSTK